MCSSFHMIAHLLHDVANNEYAGINLDFSANFNDKLACSKPVTMK